MYWFFLQYPVHLVSTFSFEVTHLVFFFFKQKTAYEMRISDWSSDVCSSDLVPRGKLQKGVCAPRLGKAVGVVELAGVRDAPEQVFPELKVLEDRQCVV